MGFAIGSSAGGCISQSHEGIAVRRVQGETLDPRIELSLVERAVQAEGVREGGARCDLPRIPQDSRPAGLPDKKEDGRERPGPQKAATNAGNEEAQSRGTMFSFGLKG